MSSPVNIHRRLRAGRTSFLAVIWLFASFFVISSAEPVEGTFDGRSNLAGAFLKRGAGARATGMGGAFAAVADDATSTYWNPAGLARIEGAQFATVHEKLSLDRSFDFISLVSDIGQKLHFGFTLLRYGVKGFEETQLDTDEIIGVDSEGNDIYDIELKGFFKDEEKCVGLSAAYSLDETLSLGGNVRYLTHTLHENSAKAAGCDLGILYKPHWRFSAGLVLKDYFSDLTWDTSSHWRDRIAREHVLGFSYRFGTRVLVAIDFSKVTDLDLGLRLGIEGKPFDALAIRAGSNRGRITLGAGFTWRNVTFDYCFEDAELDDVHRFSSNIAFSRSPKIPSLKLKKLWETVWNETYPSIAFIKEALLELPRLKPREDRRRNREYVSLSIPPTVAIQ